MSVIECFGIFQGGVTEIEIKELIPSQSDLVMRELFVRLLDEKSIGMTTLNYLLSELAKLTKSEFGYISTNHTMKCMTPTQGTKLRRRKLSPLLGSKDKIILSNDVEHDPRIADSKLKGIKTFISIPLYYKKRIIGQVSLGNKKGGYAMEDIIVVDPFVEIIGKILHSLKSESVSQTKTRSPPVAEITDLPKLKEIDDGKDKFLATMSHELRTPLNGLVGMVTMLQDAGPLNEKQTEYLGILMECSHQLMNLMNNILDFSKMASSRLTLLCNPLDINKSIKDAAIMVEGKAKSKNLQFLIDVEPNLPIVIGDQQRLTQILSNLLSNAVKFTEHGYVKLVVRFVSVTDTSQYIKKWKILFDVEDTGVGIALDEQEKIFEVFHQSPTLNTGMSKNGTGLGLSIARELVKLMGGNITIRSEGINGKGSVFSFYIVADEEIRVSQLKEKHQDIIKGAKVLIVDDRPEYRLQLTDLLYKWGCIPFSVSSGEEVLQHLKHGMHPKCIIVDICMPYMSGIELAQTIRKSYKTIPMIGLSSIDLDNGIELFDHYMPKPIDQNFLFPALLDCLLLGSTTLKKKGGRATKSYRIQRRDRQKKEVEEPQTSRSREFKTLGSISQARLKPSSLLSTELKRKKKAKEDIRILIAEDDSNNSYTLREMLKYLGYNSENIRWVINGSECVEEVKKESYDVVLMDIIMPVMDGIEATKHIRQLKPRPFVIAVSASTQTSDKQRCQQVGIDGYLTKPILKEDLGAVLSQLIVPSGGLSHKKAMSNNV